MRNSESLKLSVEAKISSSLALLIYIPASIGRTLPSAVEKSVFSIAVFSSRALSEIDCPVVILGMLGNFSGLVHLNLVSLLFVLNEILPPFSRLTSISLS